MKTLTTYIAILIVAAMCAVRVDAAVGNLVFSQVFYDTPLNEDRTITPAHNGEFIKITNIGTGVGDLSWYTIRATSASGWVYDVEVGDRMDLAPGGSLILAYKDGDTFTLPDLFGAIPTDAKVFINYHHSLILSNDGAVLELIDRSGAVVDKMEYGKTGGRLTARNGEGKAIGNCVALHRTVNVDGYCGLDSVKTEWIVSAVSPYACKPITTLTLPKPDPDDDISDTFTHADLSPGTTSHSYARHARLTTPSNGGTVTTDAALIETTYLDGLGRERERVISRNDGADLVSVIEYNDRSRVARKWLPMPSTGSQGAYVADVATMAANAVSTYGDNGNLFTAITHEIAPHGRPVEERAPGEAWQNHDGVRVIHHVNTATGRLPMLRITPGDGGIVRQGYFAAGELSVEERIDEDGHKSLTYRDMDDSVLCVQRYIKPLLFAETYYVRDLHGDIAYVLQPRVMAYVRNKMANGATLADDNDLMRQFAFVYRRDHRRRVIERRDPGRETVYTVYDRCDLPVAVQDGNLADDAKCLFTAYDELGRPAYSGVCDLTGGIEDLRAVYRDVSPRVHRESGGVFGYSLLNENVTAGDILTVNYYDDYDFIANFAVADTLAYRPMDGYGTKYEPLRSGYRAAAGLPTGGAVRLLGGSGAILPYAEYHDARGRVVQRHEMNHKGGADARFFSLSHTDMPLAVRSEHMTADTAITHVLTYTYDALNRMTQCDMAVDGSSPVTLAANEYDAPGRLTATTLPDGTVVNRTYNVRSWPTAINAPGRFVQTLKYADAATPLYNGNVGEMAWGCYAGGNRRYVYTYDGMDRLTAANYNGSETGIYSCSYTYDTNGNITSLKRRGASVCVSAGTLQQWNYGLIDDLTLTYDGNHLKKVTDQVEELTYAGAMDFKDGADKEKEYNYDANGNLVWDRNKGMSAMYNVLNLPLRADFPGGHFAEYTYAADGRKLGVVQKRYDFSIVENGGSAVYMITHPLTVTTRDYCGEYVYRNDTIERVLTPVGYLDMSSGKHHCFVNDWQGNVRAVVREDGTLVEYNSYYPYGALMAGAAASTSNYVVHATGSVQPYKYTGKELQRDNGLDTYDFGPRWYDPLTATTWQQDPKADNYAQYSPYSWCGNNPIRYTDPTGEEILNYFNPNKDKYLHSYAKKYPNDNAIHVFAHGDNKSITIYQNGKDIKIKSVSDFKKHVLSNSKIWKERRNSKNHSVTIILHSCKTGGGENSFAEVLSSDQSFENVKVVAPTKLLRVNTKTGVSTVEDKNKHNNGRWVVFKNGKLISTFMSGWTAKEKPSLGDRIKY